LFFFVPEACLLGVEDLTATISHSLRSGKNMGRKIFGVLLLMAVLSVFLKVLFWSRMEENSHENSNLVLFRHFKDDWARAQRSIIDHHPSISTPLFDKLPPVSPFFITSLLFGSWKKKKRRKLYSLYFSCFSFYFLWMKFESTIININLNVFYESLIVLCQVFCFFWNILIL
jgi:hypothetical protein